MRNKIPFGARAERGAVAAFILHKFNISGNPFVDGHMTMFENANDVAGNQERPFHVHNFEWILSWTES